MLIKNDKKTIRAWTFYDWANSVYPLVISSAIFPIFYEKVTKNDLNGLIPFCGGSFINTAFYGYVVAVSYLIVAFSSPLLSGMADYSDGKKRFLQLFCYLGSFSCIALSFFSTEHIIFSMLALMLASVGYWGSLVFYNAYLPEIADPDQHDKISARGFAMGYVGSSLLLIAILVLAVFTKTIPKIQYTFALVGLWWIGFAQVTFRRLPASVEPTNKKKHLLSSGYKELKNVWIDLKNRLQLRRFLTSYFMYNMGVQTVMIMAVPFATKAILWENEKQQQQSLIISILIIQFLGVAGAFIMSKLSSIIGNIKTIGLNIGIWAAICVYTYLLVDTPNEFYIVAACVGLVMGGIQAMSRSTYSKMLPETKDHASYFSFYDVSEKIGLAIGTTTFGLIEDATGGIRNSVLSLILIFIIGFVLLLRVPKEQVK
ncbi:MAG TPA: MFS transporter [Bacteroidia bacterium]|nr:MFS transporter [Bacteroidia bacterium]